jgi:hypothetical protein
MWVLKARVVHEVFQRCESLKTAQAKYQRPHYLGEKRFLVGRGESSSRSWNPAPLILGASVLAPYTKTTHEGILVVTQDAAGR